jgi:hypothetical protein
MNQTLIEDLRKIGLTVTPVKENRMIIGKNEYLVKSVFTGNNQETMSKTFLKLANDKASDICNTERV